MLPSVHSKISTLESQITNWESQIAELQSQIAKSQASINRLNEANCIAGGLVQAVQDGIEKISSMEPEAIADLQTALLRLFNGGGDNPTDGDSNQPIDPSDPDPVDGSSNHHREALRNF